MTYQERNYASIYSQDLTNISSTSLIHSPDFLATGSNKTPLFDETNDDTLQDSESSEIFGESTLDQ
jgi:hypothetical protein